MSDDIFNQILTNTFTLSSLNRRIRLLKKNLQNRLYEGNVGFDEAILAEDKNWLTGLNQTYLDSFNGENFTVEIEKLQKKVSELTTLVIYTSFEMPEEEASKLVQILRNELKNLIIADFKIDPTLLGGAAFVWKGIFKDYSLRKKIDDNKEGIISEFKKYLVGKGN